MTVPSYFTGSNCLPNAGNSSQDLVWFLETLHKTCALLSQPGRFETTVSMEDEISYSEEEEQVFLLPFLEEEEEEEKEDKADQFYSVEEHWEGRKFSDNSQKNSLNVSSSIVGGNRRVLGLNNIPSKCDDCSRGSLA